jgi:hypothetical protein
MKRTEEGVLIASKWHGRVDREGGNSRGWKGWWRVSNNVTTWHGAERARENKNENPFDVGNAGEGKQVERRR